MGVWTVIANGLHWRLVRSHEEDRVWVLWEAFEAYHVQQDACLRHEACSLFIRCLKFERVLNDAGSDSFLS